MRKSIKDYFSAFLFEDAPARSKSSADTYLSEVKRSDIYLGIFGNEYGAPGKDNLSATEREFRIEFLREEGIIGRAPFDREVCPGADFTEIDEDKVEWLLKTARKRRNYAIDENLSTIDAFIKLNLISENRLTNAAILLFGKNPQKYHLQAEIKCIRFSGLEVAKPFRSYHIYKGNLFEQIDKAISFVLESINFPVIQQENTAQVKRPYEVPEFVIQEAVVNAAAHRDYNTNAGIQVMVFLDRIEILNSGKLPPQLSMASLKKVHSSHPNNPLLAEVLYLSDYIQKAGSGIPEMVRQCIAKGLPEPDYINEHGEFKIIIYRDILTDSYLMSQGLSERHIRAVHYIKEKSRISNSEYQELTGLSKRQTTDDLKILEGKGILIKQGKTGKGVYYFLKGRQRGERGAKGALNGHSIKNKPINTDDIDANRIKEKKEDRKNNLYSKGLVEKSVKELVESQIKILRFIKENPFVSKKELAEKIDISTTAIDKNIFKLKQKGLLRRIGPDKGGHWKIVKK